MPSPDRTGPGARTGDRSVRCTATTPPPTIALRVLLTDGSGLTARQCATALARSGHHVEVLAPDPLCLCRFTRSVARVHPVPVYGSDPWAWLDAAIAVYRRGRFDVLLPTQEQVAVLAAAGERLARDGVATVVPPWPALGAVFDKVTARATLTRLGVAQPASAVGAEGWTTFPAYVKEAVGTASGGVRRVEGPESLVRAAGREPVLVQAAGAGPLAMCQAVFDTGSMVAFHAAMRTGEGSSGGASHKTSALPTGARAALERMGRDLGWHGALSADVILSADGPLVIDVNPRLVEPENAGRAGVDLVAPMLELARGGHPAVQPEGRPGVATHQLLLAVLGAAAAAHPRRAVAAELVGAALHRGLYRASVEELTPARGDPVALVPVVAASVATLVRPAAGAGLAAGSVGRYALGAEGWRRVLAGAPPLP